MIKDLLVSFKDNIKTKTTNPFFGTLICVWAIHNYKLVYSLFNFEKETSLEARREYLSTFLESDVFISNLWSCIKVTFLILLCTYILLNISRFIVQIFDKIVTPWIYKITDKGSVVLKNIYQTKVEESKRFEYKYEQEREAKLKLQNDYENLEKRLQAEISKNKNEDVENYKEQLNQERASRGKVSENYKDLKDRYDQLIKQLTNNPKTKYNRYEILARDKNLVNNFLMIYDKIEKEESISEKEINPDILKFKLIEESSSGLWSSTYYKLTKSGVLFHEAILDEELKNKANLDDIKMKLTNKEFISKEEARKIF